MTTTIDKVNTFTTTPSSKMHDYRMHLRTITDGLVEMAKAAGRSKYTCNQLLRECYNLVDAELKTFEQWALMFAEASTLISSGVIPSPTSVVSAIAQ